MVSGDVVQDVGFYLDQVRFAENDDFDGFCWVTSWVLEIFDLRDRPR